MDPMWKGWCEPSGSQVAADESGLFFNSEGDTCIVQFGELDEAVHVAELAADMIKDRQKLLAAITIARDQGFED